MPTYHAVGAVRGSCGHQHRTVTAAEACVRRDHADIARLPGGPLSRPYSDRQVKRTDGRPLTEIEEG